MDQSGTWAEQGDRVRAGWERAFTKSETSTKTSLLLHLPWLSPGIFFSVCLFHHLLFPLSGIGRHYTGSSHFTVGGSHVALLLHMEVFLQNGVLELKNLLHPFNFIKLSVMNVEQNCMQT